MCSTVDKMLWINGKLIIYYVDGNLVEVVCDKEQLKKWAEHYVYYMEAV